MLTSLVTHKSTLEVRLYSSHQDKILPLTCDLENIIVPELTMALKLVISPYFFVICFIHEASSLLLSHLLPRGPSGLSVLKGSHTFFWMHTKVSRYPTGRCSEMIYVKLGDPKECTGEGMLEVRLSAFSTKIKPCPETPWGPEHTWMCPSYSHKTPNKFCSVHLASHLKIHSNYPGSHTTTSMDIPIQGFII